MKYFLGYDIGSSSVKATLLEGESGISRAAAFSPDQEMPIQSPQPGWAEQDPDLWWEELVHATQKLHQQVAFGSGDILAIGISYQMHGLVCVDRKGQVLRPAIIWCDSRAVQLGNQAGEALGKSFCQHHYLNAPGNFTASKLAWVKENEPAIFDRTEKILLPGDYIAMKMTGEMATTISGLSEGIFWDFQQRSLATELMHYYGIGDQKLAKVLNSFSIQGQLVKSAADILGISQGVPVTYRAGDQPNNAWSVQVLNPGEVAAAAGTSGVIYGILDSPRFDDRSRVNAFVHVNDTPEDPRIGMLMCINGCGILYSWLRKVTGGLSYEAMNGLAAKVGPGSGGLVCIPFGNGAERILDNQEPGGGMVGLDLNRHGQAHLLRAAQEGIGFAFRHGLQIMKSTGMQASIIRAGHANMFLSPVFREIFVQVTGAALELYETDGATGAARAAGLGVGFYKNSKESFRGMRKLAVLEPDPRLADQYETAFQRWETVLLHMQEIPR